MPSERLSSLALAAFTLLCVAGCSHDAQRAPHMAQTSDSAQNIASQTATDAVSALRPASASVASQPQSAAVAPAVPKTAAPPAASNVAALAATTAVPAEPPTDLHDVGSLGTTTYTPGRGEMVVQAARKYLSQSVYMTTREMEAAIREKNGLGTATYLKAGQPIVIPGIEPQPVVEHPRHDPKDMEIRAIYQTGTTAGSELGLRMIEHWQQVGGNAVVFDIKDSDGSVSIPFNHPLAPHNKPYISNLPKFVRFLHQHKMHAIARVALFRDENIAQHHSELAVQSRRTHGPWRENGKLVWTDSSNPEVQDYDIALAKLAAKSGVDEIQFDYVRFPAEGDQADAVFHYQSAHPDWQRKDVIADFLDRAYAQLHPMGVLLSLDVFGVMAWQRDVDLNHTGQDIVAMAKHCDVLSPMIYPSHFFGMDGYATPGDAPEHFISTSMERFRTITQGSGVTLRPWLQAFAWKTKSYSPEYILAQVKTSRANGGVGFLFWNARNDYEKPYAAMPTMMGAPQTYLETAEARQARAEWEPVKKTAKAQVRQAAAMPPAHAAKKGRKKHA